jgi:hypothetical protein
MYTTNITTTLSNKLHDTWAGRGGQLPTRLCGFFVKKRLQALASCALSFLELTEMVLSGKMFGSFLAMLVAAAAAAAAPAQHEEKPGHNVVQTQDDPNSAPNEPSDDRRLLS